MCLEDSLANICQHCDMAPSPHRRRPSIIFETERRRVWIKFLDMKVLYSPYLSPVDLPMD
jgi:hypothetical protein